MHLEGQYPVLRIYHTHVALWEAYFWKYTFKHGVSGILLVAAVVQLLSHVPTRCILMDCSTPGFPVINYLPEFAEIHVDWIMMLSNHLILCYPLLLLPSIFPSIRVFSSELALHIRWPKYWSFSFSISPSNEYSGLISFRTDWLDLLAWKNENWQPSKIQLKC